MNAKLKSILDALTVGDGKQNIEDVAKSCYISVMQLHRDFYNLTGYSVGEYIRHLRLSNALCLIKASEMPLADVAYCCGYSSQQALCREIKLLLGTTATAYRSSGEYYYLSAFEDDTRFLTQVSKVTVPATVRLKYYSSVFRGIENDAVKHFLKCNTGYTGRLFGRNGKQRGSMLCYELYAEACDDLNTDGFEADGVFGAYSVRCAQVRVNNTDGDVNAAWDYLYARWLPKSMFAYAGQDNDFFENHYFEEYIYKNASPIRLKLYLPLIRKPGYRKVTLENDTSMRFLVSTKSGFHAEKEASSAVMDYLTQNYPDVIRNNREFFFRQHGGSFTCGVKIDDDMEVCRDLQILCYENQSFAVLSVNGISDYEYACMLVTNWLKENRIEPDGEPFAVYDTTKSYSNSFMKLYCPVKNVRIR